MTRMLTPKKEETMNETKDDRLYYPQKTHHRHEAIERLARFMGRHKCAAGGFCDLESCSTGHGLKHLSNDNEFDPFTRLDDAMMVAEKIHSLKKNRYGLNLMLSEDGRWIGRFPVNGFYLENKYSKVPAGAITLAALAYLDATEKTK